MMSRAYVLVQRGFLPSPQDGVLSDDAPPSPFLPSPGLKLPGSNGGLPGHGLGQGGPAGMAMQNLNNRQVRPPSPTDTRGRMELCLHRRACGRPPLGVEEAVCNAVEPAWVIGSLSCLCMR